MNRIVPGWDDRVTCSDVAQPRMYLRVSLLEHLDLRDAVLVGHSMGTGEVTRYLASYGSGGTSCSPARAPPAAGSQGVLVSPIPPYLLQTPDNPDGVPQSLFDGFAQAARADTPAWMKGLLDTFYNIDTLRGTLVSDQAWQASWNLAVTASATAAVAASAPGRPTSAPTCPRSTCPCWSCTGTPTRSCRSTRPASGCPA